MTDIKMSDVFDLPAKNGDFTLVAMEKSTDVGMDRAAIVAINAYDANQERMRDLESHAVDIGEMAKNYVSKISNLTHESALLENQLKNAIAEISELKKKAQGY